MPAQELVQLCGGLWAGCQQTENSLFQRVSGTVAKNVQGGILGILPHGERRLQVRGVNVPLTVKKRVNEGQPERLRFRPVDDAPRKAGLLLGEFCVGAAPEFAGL